MLTLLLRIVSRLAWIMPLPVLLWWGRTCGTAFYLLARRRRGETLARIQRCLGVDRSQARRFLRGAYRQLGMTGMEVFRSVHMTEAEIRSHIRFEGMERFPAEGGVITVCAHFANWEMMGSVVPLFMERPNIAVVKALKPASFDRWLHRVRERWGSRSVDRRDSARECIRLIRNGGALGFVLDQNTHRDRGVFVDFFGEQACTSDGLAHFATMTGVPIFPMFAHRTPEHKLVVEIGREIEGPRDRSSEEMLRVTQECTAAIEAHIRSYPEQWIWMHRRWRSRPEGEPPRSGPML